MRLGRDFFARNADMVAEELLGKVIVMNINGKELKSKIVETEAYFGEDDPASWARKGKKKHNEIMWDKAGKVLIHNVHKHNMLNLVAGEKGNAQAVLIRALEPLNFDKRCNGPGLLTEALEIDKKMYGSDVCNSKKIYLTNELKELFKIGRSKRVGVKNDLPEDLRFYIKENRFISRKY
jgi:DNA-3-methyladenine glycosylase